MLYIRRLYERNAVLLCCNGRQPIAAAGLYGHVVTSSRQTRLVILSWAAQLFDACGCVQ